MNKNNPSDRVPQEIWDNDPKSIKDKFNELIKKLEIENGK
jgi:hypothetical protein